MIYHLPSRTCIVTPPKCGTVVLHSALCQRPSFWYVVGQSSWDSATKHCYSKSINSHETRVDRWVLLVRNPISRILSMWKHRVSNDGYDGTLREFITCHSLAVDWYAPCASFVDIIDDVIKQEDIYEDTLRITGIEFKELINQRINVAKFDYDVTDDDKELLIKTATEIYSRDIEIGNYDISEYF